ncbi:NAD(P)/FAD-dependent oxidoreductase, partial [Nocardia gipuzkoensis]
MTGQHRIVVLGAGYPGLAAARRLVEAPGARVTVVDARAEFVERVRLHQVAAGQRVQRRNLRELLERKGIRFVQGTVVGIDTGDRQLALAQGGTVDYDTLIYALGSRADLESVAGVRDHALSVATPDDVDAMPPLRGRVLVVGGGATGIEAAAELAESRPDLSVTLVSSEEPGAWLSDRARGHIRATLERLGVSVRAGVKVVEVL